MQTGAITGYVDVAQLVLYAFWIFFAGLIWYLHAEDKREGFPPIPKPKTYRLADGRTITAPDYRPTAHPPLHEGAYRGMPLEPAGDPMTAGVGPGSWTDRPDVPDRAVDGGPRLLPLRTTPEASVSMHDTDPRGLAVYGADGRTGGTVTDLWWDRADLLFRYLEVTVPGGARVLLPVNFSRIGRDGVRVQAILGAHFAGVPALKSPDVVTMLEEEKIVAYFGAGLLYAEPSRQEPLL
jgi:photosynthetic reaction center H subunit